MASVTKDGKDWRIRFYDWSGVQGTPGDSILSSASGENPVFRTLSDGFRSGDESPGR